MAALCVHCILGLPPKFASSICTTEFVLFRKQCNGGLDNFKAMKFFLLIHNQCKLTIFNNFIYL